MQNTAYKSFNSVIHVEDNELSIILHFNVYYQLQAENVRQ